MAACLRKPQDGVRSPREVGGVRKAAEGGMGQHAIGGGNKREKTDHHIHSSLSQP